MGNVSEAFVVTATAVDINPASCARHACLAAGCVLDEESWSKLVACTPDAPARMLEIGFMVATLESLQRLCAIGDFVIYSVGNGVLAACKRVEWETRQKWEAK